MGISLSAAIKTLFFSFRKKPLIDYLLSYFVIGEGYDIKNYYHAKN
jgi:hypothetical protein